MCGEGYWNEKNENDKIQHISNVAKWREWETNDDTRSTINGCFVYKCVETKDHRW